MQLITHRTHLDALPASDLKVHITARFNQLSIMLILTRNQNESIVIDGNIRVLVLNNLMISGESVGLIFVGQTHQSICSNFQVL